MEIGSQDHIDTLKDLAIEFCGEFGIECTGAEVWQFLLISTLGNKCALQLLNDCMFSEAVFQSVGHTFMRFREMELGIPPR